MLKEDGCRYVIVGHSERRQIFGETDEMVAKKTKAALAAGLIPIVCVGETLAERESGHTERICEAQLRNGPGSLTAEEFSRILMAYEPVWAIGTGRTATPEIAAASHCYLRQCVAERFSPELAETLRILYGGSVKPDNIQGLMAQEELDGALVGGAHLDPKPSAALGDSPYWGLRNARLDEVGRCLVGWRWNYHRRMETGGLALVVLGITGVFRCQLSCVDRGCFAPERQGRGSCWRVRWCWQPNRLRSSRRCQRSLQSHHLVRCHVHALRFCHGAAHG